MHVNTTRGTRAARLGLESLEGRVVLSATTLAPAPLVGQTASASAIQIHHLPTTPPKTQAHATYATFGYHWGVGPKGPVILGTNSITGNHKSTGSVDFALVRDGHEPIRVGGPAKWVPVGFVTTTSSAPPSHPDHFHSSFSITLKLRDAASGVTGQLTFKGTINGTLTWNGAHLTATFQTPTTQKLTLGGHVYTVTLPHTIKPAGPYDSPVALYAQVQVAAKR